MIDPKRLELGVNVATGLVAASVVVALAQFILRMNDDPSGRTAGAAASRGVAASTSLDLSPIVRVAPFGVAAPVAAVAAVAGGPASTGMVLRGVMVARPQAASSAWIAAADGRVKAFQIGDDVGGGAILDTVATDHVVLRIGGRLDTLAFAKSVNRQGVADILAGIPASVLGIPAPTPIPAAPTVVVPLPAQPAAGAVPAPPIQAGSAQAARQ